MLGFRVRGFNHTGITVKDLDRAVRFFIEALGFELVSLAPRDRRIVGRITGLGEADVKIAYLQGHGHTLEFLQYLSPADRKVADYRTCDVGAAHLALDVNDIDRAVAAAKIWGWGLMGEIVAIDDGPNKGRLIAYLRHEDGIILEFIQPPRTT